MKIDTNTMALTLAVLLVGVILGYALCAHQMSSKQETPVSVQTTRADSDTLPGIGLYLFDTEITMDLIDGAGVLPWKPDGTRSAVLLRGEDGRLYELGAVLRGMLHVVVVAREQALALRNDIPASTQKEAPLLVGGERMGEPAEPAPEWDWIDNEDGGNVR